MSEQESQGAVGRIVVAFDTSPLGEAALEAAAGLAAALGAELAGLFVEDIDLVRMAELPFAHELGLASAILRRLEAPDVERALRLQASRSRERLAAAAATLNLRWSFHVVRGRAVTAVFESVHEPDVVVFGKAEQGPVGAGVRVFRLGVGEGREAQRRRFRHLSLRPIVTLFDGSARAWRALAAAHGLAATVETRLTLLVPGESAETVERLRREARSWLAERDAAARFVWLKSYEVAAVAQAVNAEDAAALVWHEETLPQDRRAFRALLAALGCPLVLVS